MVIPTHNQNGNQKLQHWSVRVHRRLRTRAYCASVKRDFGCQYTLIKVAIAILVVGITIL